MLSEVAGDIADPEASPFERGRVEGAAAGGEAFLLGNAGDFPVAGLGEIFGGRAQGMIGLQEEQISVSGSVIWFELKHPAVTFGGLGKLALRLKYKSEIILCIDKIRLESKS